MSTTTGARGRGRGRAKAVPQQQVVPQVSQTRVPFEVREQNVLSEVQKEQFAPAPPKGVLQKVGETKPRNGHAGDGAKAIVSTSYTPGERAKRPGVGTKAMRTMPVLANYFNVRMPSGVVYQYDVDIAPDRQLSEKEKKKMPTRLPARITNQIFNRLVKEDKVFARHHPVYDGNKTMVTKYPLTEVGKLKVFNVLLLEEDGRKSTFIVTLKPALTAFGEKGEVDLDPLHRYIKERRGDLPLDSIRVMDMIFRHGPMMQLVPVGRSFFVKPNSQDDVPPFGGGREIWFGYTQSLRPAEWGPMLNVDIKATVFYKEGPILNFAREVLGYELNNAPLKPADIKKLGKEVTGLRVRTTHAPIPRKYTIAGMSSKGANEIRFKLEGNTPGAGRTVSIEEYFWQQYKYKLRYPYLNCMQVQPKDKNTYIPMEVCIMLSEQHCKRRLTEQQTANMIRRTCKTPQQRFREIQNRLDETRKHGGPFMDYFGVELGRNLVEVTSRILKPPTVIYQKPDCFVPDKGAWNIADHKFFRPMDIKQWFVMNYGNCQDHELGKFADMLCKEGNRLGMKIAPVTDIKNLRNERKLGVEEILKRSKKMYPGLEMVVLVIPSRSDMSNYSEIKKVGDTELGLVTQCIKDVNVSRKCNPSLLGNLCQKINAKLGGINNSVAPEAPFKTAALFAEPVIVLGADVTHPSPGDHSPSVAAVVGSLNRHPSRFAARVRVQKSTLGGIQSRVEMILELKEMVYELLKQFERETQQKPQKIYYFRDGVSETQFPEVLHWEVNQIRQACRALESDYQPALTFLCVQKRHHTRFCPKNIKDACGKAGNVPPGTIVDTGIVSPVDFDFFLCSHFGLQGTSRPTHYSVLLDENKLSADDVQALCYNLCHTYARCTRSLSIPVPVQYAHLAAFRARNHLSQVMDFSSGSSSSGSSTDSFKNEPEILQAVIIMENLQNQMYYV